MVERVALVTGGSRGIGRATAVRLAADHGVVALSFRSGEAEAMETARRVEGCGARAVPVRCDLAEPEAGRRLVAAVLDDVGRVDSVVNNAGVADRRPLLELPLDAWAHTLAVNLSAAFVVLQAAAMAMARQGGGAIVNIGSPAGLRGGIVGAHYAASKGGLVGLTASAARELARHGVRVNLVEPAFVDTDMTRELSGRDPTLHLVPPSGRQGEPEEVAHVIGFLCSPGASYLSGACIPVSGAA